MAASSGVPIERRSPSRAVRNLVAQLGRLGVDEVFVHDDAAARRAVTALGAQALCHGRRIFLGGGVGTACGPSVEAALRHELIHVGQVRRGEVTGETASRATLEAEADRLAALERPDLGALHGATRDEIYPLLWFLPLAAAAYVLLRPNIANAPGPGDETYPSVSELQVAGEAFALFVVPGGAFTLGGRLGLGFYGSGALAGAGMTTSFRAAQDARQGQFSGAQVYVFDAVTGAVIGVIVPGGGPDERGDRGGHSQMAYAAGAAVSDLAAVGRRAGRRRRHTDHPHTRRCRQLRQFGRGLYHSGPEELGDQGAGLGACRGKRMGPAKPDTR